MPLLSTSAGRVALVIALCAPIPALAQSVDYAGLGAMMGEPVTTSVTGKPQRASEAPAALSIITHEDIARSPARDIPGLLKSLAGIDVNRWTAGQSDVAVRGGVQSYSSRLLVMVDGRQVYLDHYGFTNWNLIGVQLDEIQQIELIRGPASALFGFNAASGVVNIITIGAAGNRLSATAEAGNHGIRRVSFVGALALGDNAGLRMSGGSGREHQRAIPVTVFDPKNDSDDRHDEISATFTATPGTDNSISVNVGHAFERELQYLGQPLISRERFETSTVGVTGSHDTGWGSVEGRGYINWLDYRDIGGTDIGNITPPVLKLFNRVIVGQASVLARLGSATTLRVGGEYRDNRLRGTAIYSPEISYKVVAGSMMLDTDPSERVGLTAAVRLDRMALDQSGTPRAPVLVLPSAFDRKLTAWSFNAAALIKVGTDGQLRINGGRGVQAPSLLSLGVLFPLEIAGLPLPLALTGNPAIKPPTVWSIEIGYAQPLGENVKFGGSVFYNRIEDFLGQINNLPLFQVGPTGTPALVGAAENVGDLVAYGVELSLSATSGRWTGQANYSWVRTDDDKLDADAFAANSLNPGSAGPRHKLNAQVSYDAGRWFGTVVGRYTSSSLQAVKLLSFDQALVRVPASVALDAKVGWRLSKQLTVSVAGENLTRARGAVGAPIWADRRLRAAIELAL